MRRIFVIILLISGCRSEKPLKILGEVPAFTLVDQRGAGFSRAALDGHVWIADFVFTNCQGPCPRMSSKMRALQNTGLALVSFTVDPDNDTPPVLAAYARRFGADGSRWHFLTGSKDTLNALDRDTFKLGTLGAEMEHSTRFVLVDRKSRIRGYYGLSDADLVAKISRDAARLEKENG